MGGRVIIAGTEAGRKLECLEEGENEVNGRFILGTGGLRPVFIGVRAIMG